MIIMNIIIIINLHHVYLLIPLQSLSPLCHLLTAQITLHRKQTRTLPNSHVGTEICETNLGILLVVQVSE